MYQIIIFQVKQLILGYVNVVYVFDYENIYYYLYIYMEKVYQ